MEMRLLLSKFPQPWRRLFGVLAADDDGGTGVRYWLLEESDSLYGSPLSWNRFLDELTCREPVSRCGKLEFVPRISVFPEFLQKRITWLIYQHRDDVDISKLKTYCELVTESQPSYCWLSRMVSLLDEYIAENYDDIHDRFLPYRFTSGNCNKAASICEELRSSSSGKAVGFCSILAEKENPSDAEDSIESEPLPLSVDTPNIATQSPMEIDVKDFTADKKLDFDSTDNITLSDETSAEVAMDVGQTEHNGVDLQTQNQVEKLKEIWGSCMEDVEKEDLSILLQSTPQQMDDICRLLDPLSMSEESLATACRHVCGLAEEISFSNSLCFTKAFLLHRVKHLTRSASRVVVGAVTLFSEYFPQQVVEALLVLLLISDVPGAPQVDIVTKVLKDYLRDQHKTELLRLFLRMRQAWSEPVLPVLLLLTDSKLVLEAGLLSDLVSSLEDNCERHAANLKFTKIILAVINKYAKQLRSADLEKLQHVLDCNKTFLKKSAQTALAKLSKLS